MKNKRKAGRRKLLKKEIDAHLQAGGPLDAPYAIIMSI